MPKFFATACLALLLSSAVLAMSVDDLKMMHNMIANCVATVGANDDEVADMMEMIEPSTPAGNCLHACIMETSNVIVDGKFNAANAIAEAQRFNNNDESKMSFVTAISNECEAKLAGGDPDNCAYAKKVVQCNVDGAKDRGVSQKDLFNPN